jgi:hypothetical protein
MLSDNEGFPAYASLQTGSQTGVGCQGKEVLDTRVKLHHLLQKCSFFLIKLAAFQASGGG